MNPKKCGDCEHLKALSLEDLLKAGFICELLGTRVSAQSIPLFCPRKEKTYNAGK